MTDEELMLAYSVGDVASFKTLYERHKGRVLGYLLSRLKSRSEAEEVFQEVFAKLHRHRRSYREEMPFLAWLFSIVRNSLIDHLRRQATRERHLELNPEYISTAEGDPGPQTEMSNELPELASLTPQQRMMLRMRFDEGFSFAEIAESLAISQSNARKIVSRAIHKLRSLMLGKEA